MKKRNYVKSTKLYILALKITKKKKLQIINNLFILTTLHIVFYYVKSDRAFLFSDSREKRIIGMFGSYSESRVVKLQKRLNSM